jgi:hypothetical protein
MERPSGLVFDFCETFLVFQVHEDWGGRGGGGDASSSGQFYVRNQLERWSSRE